MYNSDFFKINTFNKAYLLGLYYADGYVSYQPDKYRYFSGIMLARKDEALLDSIKEEFSFFTKSIDPNRPRSVSLRCNKKKFLEDLIKNGCHPNKSSINKDKISFPKIKPLLYSDFIRGYFDGDGSVIFTKSNQNSRNCHITSNNKILIRQIKFILYLNNITSRLSEVNSDNSPLRIIRGGKVQFKGIVYILHIHMNKANRKRFANYIYKPLGLKLNRKFEILSFDKDVYLPRIQCSICKSKNTTGQKDRIFCKDCNKHITITGIPRIEMAKKQCKHCNSWNTVGSGTTKSRINKQIVSQTFICKDCKRKSSYKITAPDNSNVVRVQDQPF